MYIYQDTYGDYVISRFTSNTSIFGKILKNPEAFKLYKRPYATRADAETAKSRIEAIIT